MSTMIINPITHRHITSMGATHRRLIRDGVLTLPPKVGYIITPDFRYVKTLGVAHKRLIKNGSVPVPVGYVILPNNALINITRDSRNRRKFLKKYPKTLYHIRNGRLVLKQTFFPFAQLEHKVGMNDLSAGKFEIELTSSSTGFKRTFQFNSFIHFQNWFRIIIDEREDYTGTNRVDDNERDIFQFISLAIREVGGGCNKHGAKEAMVDIDNFHVNLFSPYSELNNCGIKAIDYLLGTKLNCKRIRFDMKIVPNTPLSYENLLAIYNANKGDAKPLMVCDEKISKINLQKYNYILLYQNHYYVITTADKKKVINDKKLVGVF